MGAYVQKGKAVLISTVPTPTAVAITGVSAANPAVVTVPNTAAPGDIIRIEGTGFQSVDGQVFEVISATPTAVTIGADTSGESAAATAGSAFFYSLTDGSLVETCFSNFGFNREAGATITAATFCGTNTFAGAPGAQTIEFAGFDDPESEGLEELIKAQRDGIPRVVVYNYPPSASSVGNGYKLLFPSVTIAGLNGPIASTEAAATFTGTAVSNGTPTYTQYQ